MLERNELIGHGHAHGGWHEQGKDNAYRLIAAS